MPDREVNLNAGRGVLKFSWIFKGPKHVFFVTSHFLDEAQTAILYIYMFLFHN